MQVKFTDKAIAHLESIFDIFLEYAGERSAIKFSKLVDEKIGKLKRWYSVCKLSLKFLTELYSSVFHRKNISESLGGSVFSFYLCNRLLGHYG